MRHYTVNEGEAGLRLDQYLHQVFPEHTRAFIQKLIKGGSVFVDQKKTLKASLKMKPMQKVVVIVPSIKEIGIEAEAIPLEIVYEDPDIVVVNKAAGMVVHPTDRGAHVSGTLVNAILHHCPHLSGIGGEKRPGIVHRLDKDTSGLIMVAKSDHAHQHLSKQIEGRTVTKKYLTLLRGHLKPLKGSIEAPILKTEGVRDVKISNRSDAKYALTRYVVKEYVDDFSLVEVEIVTGRTHQIRIHFAAIGHPVCGDSMYGDNPVNAVLREKVGLKRQFLHAAQLKFRLPKTNDWMELKAPLPPDLKDVLRKLGLRKH